MAGERPRGFPRWLATNVGVAIPQSMAPITFGLAGLAIGSVRSGALMMTAMTVAQVVGAVPLAAAGGGLSALAYARVLMAFRTLAFIGLTLAIAGGLPLVVLVATAALAGLVNGAVFGILRAILNDVVAASKLPRALGMAAAANELVFVTGPILASLIGAVSVVGSVAVMAGASFLPVVLLPRMPHGQSPRSTRGEGSIPTAAAVWVFATVGSSACVSSVEVGAVALAIRHDLAPSAALLFTVPLCLASTLGGVWVSVRNRRWRQSRVAAMLLLTGAGMVVVASTPGVAFAISGVVLVGAFLAPLDTSFSLSLEDILPAGRRAEGFALLRAARGIGLIIGSSALAFRSLHASFLVAAALALISAIMIAALHHTTRT